jgi:hypothetical protein
MGNNREPKIEYPEDPRHISHGLNEVLDFLEGIPPTVTPFIETPSDVVNTAVEIARGMDLPSISPEQVEIQRAIEKHKVSRDPADLEEIERLKKLSIEKKANEISSRRG